MHYRSTEVVVSLTRCESAKGDPSAFELLDMAVSDLKKGGGGGGGGDGVMLAM